MGQLVGSGLVAGPAVNAARRTHGGRLREERGTEWRAEIRGRTVRSDVARLPWRLPFSPLGAAVLQRRREATQLVYLYQPELYRWGCI